MSEDARALRAALEEAQAELKASRRSLEGLEQALRERQRARAQLARASDELAQVQAREKDLVDTLLEAKRLASPFSSLEQQLALLRAEEQGRRGLSGGTAVLIATAIPVIGLMALAVRGAEVIDRGMLLVTGLLVAGIGVVVHLVGPGRPR